jgi:hypothetical protein
MTPKEIYMHGRTTALAWRYEAARLLFLLLATAALLASTPAPAAQAAAEARGLDATLTVTAFPPSVIVAAADDPDSSTSTDGDERRSRRGRAVIRIDSDRDFESFKHAMETAPWIVGLIFLVVGSIFLTPVILLIGIVWYKLRKTRLQNEALLRLAEAGVVAPAQAVDAVRSGVMPEAGATAAAKAPDAPAYQQAVATRRRAVWSDLRKGVLLGAVGLSFVMYSAVENSSANWPGFVLLFVGVAYIVLWWLEDRHLTQRSVDKPSD